MIEIQDKLKFRNFKKLEEEIQKMKFLNIEVFQNFENLKISKSSLFLFFAENKIFFIFIIFSEPARELLT